MKHASLVRLAGALAFAAFTLSGPVAQGHDCSRHADPNHKHCGGGGPSNLGEVIAGTATVNAVGNGAISDDALGTYHDGDATTNVLNQLASMQVAMNCKANHFNLNPGGGPAPGRRIHVDFVAGAGAITTAIDSCDIQNTPDDTVIVTDTLMTTPTCTTDDPDWGFDQVLRATPIDGKNVCQLVVGDPSTASARFQTNLRHLDGCKGGKGKCGIHGEGIDLNWDGETSWLTIACVLPDGNGQCINWKITSTGFPILEQESQSGGVAGDFPIDIDFVAD